MWPITAITKKLSIQHPIIQAPMAGGATTPELVAAVSNAGGLGSLGAGYMAPHDIRTSIQKIRALTKHPFAVNLFIPEEHHVTTHEMNLMCNILEKCVAELNIKITPVKPPYSPSFDEQIKVIIDEKIPVFSFTFGIPSSSWISQLKNNNTILVGTATNLDEALLLEKSGIDFIVAQGCEAGGHRGTFLGKPENSLIQLKNIIPQFVEHVKIPIIAAGGIMNARGIADSLMLGADGVQMGTAFLSCKESGIHPSYKEKLLNTINDTTTLTCAFSGKTARGINNKFISFMENYRDKILNYPIQNTLTKSIRKEAEKQNNTDFMSIWAGQSAYLCQDCSADELIKQLINEANSIFNK